MGELCGHNVKFGLERPEDPEKNTKKKQRWLTPSEASAECCSFWVTDVFLKTKAIVGGSVDSFDQGVLGHATQKSTTFWSNLGVNLEGIRSYGKSNKLKDLKSEWLARWAPGFRNAIIRALRPVVSKTKL